MDDIKLLEDERLDYINADLSLIQKKNGLTFGTDAYLLSSFARKGKNFADLGSGTGVASFLVLANNKANNIIAYEIQKDFCELIERNAVFNKLNDRIEVINTDIRNIDYSKVSEKFDVVISNPPYIKNDSGLHNLSEYKNIARREIFGDIYSFCESASKLLKYGGYFYTVYLPERTADLIEALKKYSLEPKRMIIVYPTIASAPCIVLIESKKGASTSLQISRPLIIYDDDRQYTDDMNKIYENFTMEHLFKNGKN